MHLLRPMQALQLGLRVDEGLALRGATKICQMSLYATSTVPTLTSKVG